tara:strand:- start:1215 stop:1418 length:204 start_codon:yes stop_codon:yes gene_type:complete
MNEKSPIYTKHYAQSVVEVYLNEDQTKVYQIKCLTRNRCRKYTFDTEDYLQKQMIGYQEIQKKLINR